MILRVLRIAWFWLPPAVLMSFIYLASADTGSGERSFRLVLRLLRLFEPNAEAVFSLEALGLLDMLLRKIAHFMVYAMLALLLLRAICRGKGAASSKPFLSALGLCMLYAVSDELHQAYVPGRVGMWQDVLLDSVAGASVILASGLLKLGAQLDTRIGGASRSARERS